MFDQIRYQQLQNRINPVAVNQYLNNPHDKPILSDQTQTVDRLKIEQRFKLILPRELLAATKAADPKAIPKIIQRVTANNCWGLWLAGMKHGRDHATRELRMVRGKESMKYGVGSIKSGSRLNNSYFILHTFPRLANFALLDDQDPPSRMQNKRTEKAIWERVNTLAGNVADTEWERIQAALRDNVRGDISRVELQAAIADTLGGERFKGRSESIARTELTFAYNAGRVETYRENNVEAIRRYCISDERTCEQCAGLNGMVARLDDMAACMRIFAPSHVSCRCTTGVVLDIKQLAEANRQPPPLAEKPWMMGLIVAAIIGG